jgi:hypothetical protein
MKTNIRTTGLYLIIVFLFPWILAASAPGIIVNAPFEKSSENQDAFEVFFQLSGLEVQIRELTSIILEQFYDEINLVPLDARPIIEEKIIQAFDSDKLVRDARRFLLEEDNAHFVDEVNRWLGSPLTKRMNELELASNDPENLPDREAWFDELEQQMPPQSRLDIIRGLEEQTDATFYLVSIVSKMYVTLIQTMNPYMPAADQIPAERFEQIRMSIMGELMPLYRNVTLAMNLYTYKDVSDQDLKEYVSFYDTDAGQWFVEVSYEVIDEVLNEAARRLNIR